MTNLFEQTLSTTIAEAEQKLKALRPVVKWYPESAIHSQHVCLNEYLTERAYDGVDAAIFTNTTYLDIDSLHLYIVEPNYKPKRCYYCVELIPDELDLYDIADDVQTIDNMEYVDARWLTAKTNREYLIRLLRKSIADDEERRLDMSVETWDDLMARDALGYNIEFNQYIIDRLVRLN